MFSLILNSLKWVVFGFLILLLGNVIKWEGKTVSDRIETTMARTELNPKEIIGAAKGWFGFSTPRNEKSDDDHLSPSDQKKLKGLLERLDSTQDARK